MTHLQIKVKENANLGNELRAANGAYAEERQNNVIFGKCGSKGVHLLGKGASKGGMIISPFGCRTATVDLPFETSMPTDLKTSILASVTELEKCKFKLRTFLVKYIASGEKNEN